MKIAAIILLSSIVAAHAQPAPTRSEIDSMNTECEAHKNPPPTRPTTSGVPLIRPAGGDFGFQPGWESCTDIQAEWRKILSGERDAGMRDRLKDISGRIKK